VSRLRCCSLGRSGTQLLARRFAGPCTGIDIPHDSQPFLGLFLAGEESHVQAEALASLLETAADEKGKALELGQIRLRERHRRRRRAQIENERPRLCGRSRRMVRIRHGGCQICRWCHKFPGHSIDQR
jgi:plasmid stabilization system protein ParE